MSAFVILNADELIIVQIKTYASVTSHKYSNEEITVVWQPNLCIHSTICWKGLRQVFDPAVKPWIKVQGATTQTIIEQVRKCPRIPSSYFVTIWNNVPGPIYKSRAVGYNEYRNNAQRTDGYRVRFTRPFLPTVMSKIQKETVSICRCGRSASNKPYYDDSHLSTTVQG